MAATLAVLALLAAMLLPTLAESGGEAKAFRCQSNLRRLTAAWLEFATDNNDRIMGSDVWIPTKASDAGYVSWGYPGNTNTASLADPRYSSIAAYVNPISLIKCPADQFQSQQNLVPRVRSVSMNAVLGASAGPHVNGTTPDGKRNYYGVRFWPGGHAASSFSHLSQPTVPGPSMLFVFLDEHPDSINDGRFMFEPGFSPPQYTLRDVPGSLHDGALSLSYADGHCELHKWRDGRTRPPVAYVQRTAYLVVGSSLDYEWLQDRMPYRY